MPKPLIHTYSSDSFGFADASCLSNQLSTNQTSATELVIRSFDRLDQVQSKINAVVCTQRTQALRVAESFDRSPRTDGFGFIPSFLKDNLDLKGLPTRHGSRATPSERKSKQSAIANQLAKCGLVWMGKSSLPEFGLTATTEYSRAKATLNPWNPEHSTGGSSGGAAALVAAGVVPIAHGNDGGGSIRIPAACCGLIGLKPSRGRLTFNEMAKGLPIQIVSDGVLTRSVRDTARLLEFAEAHYKNKTLPSIRSQESSRKNNLKIAYFSQLPTGGRSHEDCEQAVERAADFLSGKGHRLEKIEPPIPPEFADDFLLYWASMAMSLKYLGKGLLGRKFRARNLEPFTQELSNYALKNVLKLPFALNRLRQFASLYESYFKDYDLVLSPVLGTPPPKIGHLSLDLPFELARERLFNFACFTAAQNVSGAPGISLPIAVNTDNLPIGVHLAAPFGRDSELIELAFQFERHDQLISWSSD